LDHLRSGHPGLSSGPGSGLRSTDLWSSSRPSGSWSADPGPTSSRGRSHPGWLPRSRPRRCCWLNTVPLKVAIR